MPAPYPIELRERVVGLLETGKEPLEVSTLMNLGVATVGRWKRRWKERGSVEPQPQPGGGKEKLGVEGKEFLLNFVGQYADATLADMGEALADHLDIEVVGSTISAFLVERGYTWKKKTFRLREKDAEALLKMQAEFIADVASLDPERVVYLDECGANEAMTPTRARSLEGERAYAPRPTRRGEKITIIGALTTEGMGPTTAFAGNVTLGSFIAYMMEDLLPLLLPGTIIVMDRLAAHCNEQVRIAIERAGCKLKLLPPYSPELNPIEEAWSKLKHLLRKLGARSRDALLGGVVELVDRITANDARGFIAHAGYGGG